VVDGGCLPKPQHVAMHTFEGQHFVKVVKSEYWLCVAASGKHRDKKPLSRTDLIEKLCASVAAETSSESPSPSRSGGVRNGMDGLGLDEPVAAGTSPQTSKHRSRVSRASYSGQRACEAKRQQHIVTVAAPGNTSDELVKHVRCLAFPPKGLKNQRDCIFLHIDDLPWLIESLAGQVARGGVDYDPEASQLRKPYWSNRDGAWICRAMSPNGELMRKSCSVPVFVTDRHGARRALSSAEYAQVRDDMLAEIQEWQKEVELGNVQ